MMENLTRRHFLAVAAGLGLASPAMGLEIGNCQDGSAARSCRPLADHAALLARVRQAMDEQGLTAEERQAVLATVICPSCGLALADEPGVLF